MKINRNMNGAVRHSRHQTIACRELTGAIYFSKLLNILHSSHTIVSANKVDNFCFTEPDEALNSQDLRIVLLGLCGARKSSTANGILGQEAFKESRTTESEKQTGIVEDRNISIIDTPGFFNTHLTDEEMKKQMMKSLCLSDPGPHVFLLVINLRASERSRGTLWSKFKRTLEKRL